MTRKGSPLPVSPTARALGALGLAAALAACDVARVLQGQPRSGCERCHAAPPASGAHLRHAGGRDPAALAYGGLGLAEDLGPPASADYAFGCGHCHPLDPASHLNGRVEVEVAPGPGAEGSLKAMSLAGATYDRPTRTCAGVYCHSSGQEVPSFAPSPSWNAPPGALGCGGCHAFPPRYPSGGPGAPDANSHLVFADDEWESGHFGGLPGPWHTSKHGGNWAGQAASPITCQTCHYESVAPGASFYWLNTAGDYHLPGGDPTRLTDAIYVNFQCTACHAEGGTAAPGADPASPFRHVNGRRDVTFDPRPALDPLPWLPAAPNAPTRPTWVTGGAPGVSLPDPSIPDAVFEGTTLSMTLASARYDGVSKTCASVACHLQQTSVRWGAPHGWSACMSCHGF